MIVRVSHCGKCMHGQQITWYACKCCSKLSTFLKTIVFQTFALRKNNVRMHIIISNHVHRFSMRYSWKYFQLTRAKRSAINHVSHSKYLNYDNKIIMKKMDRKYCESTWNFYSHRWNINIVLHTNIIESNQEYHHNFMWGLYTLIRIRNSTNHYLRTMCATLDWAGFFPFYEYTWFV